MKTRVKMTEITSEMKAYEIKFLNGLYFRVLNYGISVTDWGMGDQESWVLKHPKDETYLKNKDYLGCVIGPYTGRIANASFLLNKKHILLDKNEGDHCLHGGNLGLSRVYWQVDYTAYEDEVILTFTYDLKKEDGFINYPAYGLYRVVLTVKENKEISFEYKTDLEEASYISLTHHIYFKTYNLQDCLYIKNQGYLQLNEKKIPTGLIMTVPLELEMPLKTWFKVLNQYKGIDHPFILKDRKQTKVDFEDVIYTSLKYQLRVSTTCPYMVIYSGGYLENPFSGIAFEPQELPNGPNQKMALIKQYMHKTSYRITEHDGDGFKHL